MTRSLSKFRAWQLLVFAGAFAALAACDGLGSSATEDDPAYLQFNGLTSTIVSKDTVAKGSVFSVSFDTYGLGCTNQVGGDEVTVTGSTVDIRPTNRTTAGPTCGTDVVTITHTVTASVQTAGPATIKVTGLTDQPQTGSANNLFAIQKTITVQ